MLGRDRYGFYKKHDGTHYTKSAFLHPVGSMGDVVYSGVSIVRNIDELFIILRWDRHGFHKKHAMTHYAEPVFLHPVRPVGHVMHSGASRLRNVEALFFIPGWDRYGCYKNCEGLAKLVFFYLVGSAGT
jgi:hypothetical protein